MSDPILPATQTPTLLADASRRLAESLAALSPDADGAFVAVATTEGAKVAIVSRLGEHWTIEAYAAKPYKGPLEAGATVIGTW